MPTTFAPELEAAPVRLVVDDQRLARLDDPAGQALAELERLELVAVLVREVDDAGTRVEQRDVGDVGLEDRADLLADEVEQVGEVELAGELLRDRVDRRELGGALAAIRRTGARSRSRPSPAATGRRGTRARCRRTARPPCARRPSTPLTVLPASSGATISRSSSASLACPRSARRAGRAACR